MIYRISKSDDKLKGEVLIPSSKSISNRVLIINALNYSGETVRNLSKCEDTQVLNKVLYSNSNEFDVGDAGTAMRFLTAYLSKVMGEWIVTGSDRMKERPIGDLVDALNHLGAQISYMEKDGYPPLRILGSNLTGDEVTIPGSTSSQFISSLLLIAPTLKNGLTIKMTGDVVSLPYIHMTLGLMEEFGVKYSFQKDEIKIKHQPYTLKPYAVEGDWSGASYWYSFMALASEGRIKLTGVKPNSLQGDSGLIPLFEKLGVKTVFSKRGTFLEKCDVSVKQMVFDFGGMPDLVQTFVVCCAMKNIHFKFTGLETLAIKETDRIEALICQLRKMGYVLSKPQEGTLEWDGTRKEAPEDVVIETYNDHRMAMAFAPVAITGKAVNIKEPHVVRKSYPQFWEHLQQMGFEIEEK